MTWSCEQTEARLSEYFDNLLEHAEQSAFDQHVNSCERCSLLVISVFHALAGLHKLEQVEPSPQLVESILTATQGPRTWRNAKRWLHTLQSPRFVYSAVSVAATIVVLLTATGFNWHKPKLADLAPATLFRNADRQAHLVYARGSKFVSDLRVVYEIQTRMNDTEPNPTERESTVPQTSPDPNRDRTDKTNPTTPRQQNRANDLSRRLEVVAAECPLLIGAVDERSPQ